MQEIINVTLHSIIKPTRVAVKGTVLFSLLFSINASFIPNVTIHPRVYFHFVLIQNLRELLHNSVRTDLRKSRSYDLLALSYVTSNSSRILAKVGLLSSVISTNIK